jgi:hypothetical protein
MTLLTKRQAEESVITRLKSRCAAGEISLAEWRGSERAFGWVFEVSVIGANNSASPASAIPRWVIVNKHSQQVVASSLASDVEQFVRLYEKLLAQNQTRSQGWCGTLPLPFPWSLWRKRTVAERAREGGFYEIGGKEGEP